MRDRQLLKAACCSGVSLLTLLVLGSSVAGRVTSASDEPVFHYIHEASRPVRVAMPTTNEPYRLLAAVDQPDIRPEDRLLADLVIRALPSGCDRQLVNFYMRYDNPSQRGLGGRQSIVVARMPSKAETAALIVHECMHLFVSASSGNPASGDSGWRDGQQIFYADSPMPSFFSISWESESVLRKGAKAEDFASGYGKTNEHEDAADFFASYILHRGALKERAKTNGVIAAKLAWMEAHLPSRLNEVVISEYQWDKKVPWDVTKLPFRWHVLDIAWETVNS